MGKKISQKELKKKAIKILELIIEEIKTSKEITNSSIKVDPETDITEIIRANMSYEELVPQRTGWINLEFSIRYRK